MEDANTNRAVQAPSSDHVLYNQIEDE